MPLLSETLKPSRDREHRRLEKRLARIDGVACNEDGVSALATSNRMRITVADRNIIDAVGADEN